MAVFSMSVVCKLTELTARQIRYYETHELIKPERTEGNKRLFSMNDLERLLEIKALIEKGVDSKRYIVPGAGHSDEYWFQPEVTELIIDFLNKKIKNI